MKPGIADIGPICRAEAEEEALGEAGPCRCREVVLSGEAGTWPALVRMPLEEDLMIVPVEVEGCGFLCGDWKTLASGGRGVVPVSSSSRSSSSLL